MSEPKPYQYDFSGSCAPGNTSGWNNTFSFGIFQWLPKKRRGLKRGKVIKRIKGLCSEVEEVKKRAQDYCDKLNKKEEGV